MPKKRTPLAERFRGFLPVVIDVETGGFNAKKDALLEIASVILQMDDSGFLEPGEPLFYHVKPFPGANIDPAALKFTGIKPDHPFRFAVDETQALNETFKAIRHALKEQGCSRAILVGHNAFFDHGFLKAAVERNNIKHNPFHQFSCFDTVSFSGLAYGQTVLARSCQAAGIDFNDEEAHSAKYDADRTAHLFCNIVNKWKTLGGWCLSSTDFVSTDTAATDTASSDVKTTNVKTIDVQ